MKSEPQKLGRQSIDTLPHMGQVAFRAGRRSVTPYLPTGYVARKSGFLLLAPQADGDQRFLQNGATPTPRLRESVDRKFSFGSPSRFVEDRAATDWGGWFGAVGFWPAALAQEIRPLATPSPKPMPSG